MKRSDMVELMKDAWNGCMSFKSDLAMANYVLIKMEEAGMLPPQKMLGTIPVVVELHTKGAPCHLWEDEDE